MNKITYQDVRNNKEFKIYVEVADKVLRLQGFTDHSVAHTTKVGETAAKILLTMEYSEEEAELAKIAGYIHDIGNLINRRDHAQTGAIMGFQLLTKMGMNPEEIAVVVSAVGNHDEDAGIPVGAVSAAIILADKTDVRRSRVRNRDFATFDIHDRVNHAVEKSDLTIDKEKKEVLLSMSIDTDICSVVDYFEIFLSRMLMCKRAAHFLGLMFKLEVNGTILL